MRKNVLLIQLLILFALCCSSLMGQQISIIPEPVSVVQGTGQFEITKNTKIYADKDGYQSALFLAELLRKPTGYKIPVVESNDPLQAQDGISFFYRQYNWLGR